ncbi:glycosyltransferase family 2 protein [Candidatus Parcubacteria bacterium]|nr:glycosyltransferase family 2 protein [Candidatus Parcubacteria bacterium]
MTKLSVIVNHYRTPEILRICLRSIKENLKNADFDWELIVTDSATIEKTEEMMEDQFSNVIFIPAKENIGFGRSINIAVKKAKGDYFFIVNADILIEEEKSIEKMLEYIEKNKDVGMVGPKLLNVNNTVQQSCFRFYTPLTVICRRTILGKTSFGKKILGRFLMNDIFSKENVTEPIPVDWLMGSAMMIRKSDLEKVGVFDESFFMYFEDVDWARRFWENGLKVIYFPNSVMYHYHFQSSKKKSLFDSLLSKYARIHIKSALKYFMKYKFKNAKYGL